MGQARYLSNFVSNAGCLFAVNSLLCLEQQPTYIITYKNQHRKNILLCKIKQALFQREKSQKDEEKILFNGDISVFHEWHQKSGWRDLNPRHSGPKPDALPAALHPVISINLTDKENNVNHS